MTGGADGGAVDRVESDVSLGFDDTARKPTDRRHARRLSTGLRGTVAALSVIVGLYAFAEWWPSRAGRAYYAVFGIVVILGGMALLLTARPRWRVGWLGRLWVFFVAAVGTAAGLAAGRDGVCCAFTYSVHRGYPFRWLHASLDLDSLVPTEQARTLMLGQPDAVVRTADWPVAGIDALFWAYLGLLLVIAARLARHAVSALDGHGVGGRP